MTTSRHCSRGRRKPALGAITIALICVIVVFLSLAHASAPDSQENSRSDSSLRRLSGSNALRRRLKSNQQAILKEVDRALFNGSNIDAPASAGSNVDIPKVSLQKDSSSEYLDENTELSRSNEFDTPSKLLGRRRKYGRARRMERKIKSIPKGWRYKGPAPRKSRIRLDFFVKQHNTDVLEQSLVDVSDPESPNYGKFWNVEQINKLVAPHSDAIQEIFAWLREFNITERDVKATANGDILSTVVSTPLAEAMLNANFSAFFEEDSKRTVLRTEEYFLPEEVGQYIDFIGPTVRFPQISTRKFGCRKKSGRKGSRLKTKKRGKGRFRRSNMLKSSPNSPANLIGIPNEDILVDESGPQSSDAKGESEDALRKETDFPTVTPALIKQVYNLGDHVAKGKASLGIASFLNQFMSMNDLRLFFREYSPNVNYTLPTIRGFNNESNPGAEASLDIQYVMALSEGIKDVQFWSTLGHQDGAVDNEPFLEWLFDVANATSPATVFSISYGDDEETVFEPYARRVNVEFQKAGLRGISLLAASGDGGVAGARPNPCEEFVPTFPAASPWITAVGGTTSFYPEIGSSLSGGGFSNRWARPQWQDRHVEGYFKKVNPDYIPEQRVYNQTGAGFPDVSAQSLRFPIVVEGEVHVTDGTSASAPIVAAIVGLLNDVRAEQGKGPLGFLNPLFYKRPEMFTDIIDGFNPGCGGMGFSAAEGWDPVTGLGSPDFQKMKAVVESLP